MTPDFLSVCRLDFTPLAPIHIGSGEDLDPTSYVLEADTFYEFPSSALATILDDADRSQLLRLVDGSRDEQVLTGVQEFFFKRREALVAHASRAVRATSGVQELHKSRIGTTAQRETGAINRLEIERLFSHPDTRAPILPGSSAKGAIRTALLNQENQGRPLADGEESLSDRKKSRKLQERLFGYRGGFAADPMRLVHVADAMYRSADAIDTFLADTAILFAVNRKRRKVFGKDDSEIRSQAERKGLYQTLEVLPALQWRSLRGSLTVHRTHLPASGGRLPRDDLRWTTEGIARACNQFYRPDFEDEAKEMRDRGFLDERWYEAIRKIMEDGLAELLDSHRAFLLRVGRHSGAESVTLNGVRNIRIMTPRGQENRFEGEATTWWLASSRIDAWSGLLPFGWVLVEMTEGDESTPSRPGITEVIRSFHAESGAQEWRGRVVQRRAERRREQEMAASRQAEVERRRREQEAMERAHEAKRAAMTNEERTLDDLRALFAKTQQAGAPPQTQGGELASHANQLLKAAREWPEVLRPQAADLIEEIFRTIGFPKGRKGRERKQQISDLRGNA